MIRTTIHAGQLEPHEQFGTLLIGFGESLHNIGLGLCLVIIAAIAIAFGTARRRAAAKAELVDV